MERQSKLLRLVEMNSTMTNFNTVALIVSKNTPNYFTDKTDGSQRGVLTLTIRDGLFHYTNCKLWGKVAWVQDYVTRLQIGEVVLISNAKVMDQASESSSSDASREHRYDPKSSLNCALAINEGHGSVEHYVPHVSDDFGHFYALEHMLHRPLKSMVYASKLMDVISRFVSENKVHFVEVVVVVAVVRPLRKVKVADSHHSYAQPNILDCLEVVVSDPTHPEGMLLTIWQEDWIQRGQKWKPLQTVLHLVDVKASYSMYHKFPTFSHVSCTLITEDPHPPTAEVNHMMEFAASLKFYSFENLAIPEIMCSLPYPENITEVMNVKTIYARSKGFLQNPMALTFTAKLIALISSLDLDGFSSTITRQCAMCHRFVPRCLIHCPTEECQLFSDETDTAPWLYHFNITVHFSDQSGTLVEGRLAGLAAERVLGVSAADFVKMSEREKGLLKWKFLLRHFEVKLLVLKPIRMRNNMIAVVVDMHEVPLED
ncbi:protein hold'em [Drosophila bipectinata]|uniref:protein hold'em n=1 Tax=Drosophila bipectinata TaxID=42026 RepID=UPI001C8A72B8|nr:protein hold'em [Drosophila bipectinata]